MEALRDVDPARIGAYALLARLGAGGMGQVYLGRSPGGRLVAVKVIRDEITGHPEALARFRREAETVRAVRSAYTANLIDASLAAPPFWLATEYVAGPTLARAVAERGALPADTCRRLFAALAEGLASVHAYGVTHRDLKPQNVILGGQGPQLIDFGIARGVGETALTQDGQAPGTPGYTAPEVLLGAEAGAAADVFALGATLAYAATGRPPFGTGVAATVGYRAVHEPIDVAGVERGLAALIEACVAKDPAARPTPAEVIGRCGVRDALIDDPVYPGLGALGEAVPLHEMRTQGPGTPPGYTPTQPSGSAPARPAGRRLAWAAAGTALVVVAALVGWKVFPLGGEGADGGRNTATGPSATPAGGPSGAAPGASPSASTGTGTGKPAQYIENNQISRYFWHPSTDPVMAGHGVGQCNLGAEEKPPGADMQTGADTSGKSVTISMRIKYAEMSQSKPAPYYVSVAVRPPHDIDPDTGKPFPLESKAVGYTSKPIDIYSKWNTGEFLTLTYPDDFIQHSAGKTWPAIPLANDPGDWTTVFYHVEDDPTKYASINCSGFRVG
ncbi:MULTISPECIES: serine/threonine-protein kinase [unclassified Streptomyces]|uniref:serine/threonine-protein kinase n=1 Tax=unclassified Streptomyces TaxID=2593676 RepID=UPI002E13DA28|nr:MULTISPECIES: serine/threonine-protein kinase [unclassified Streptomyces]WSR26724.1 protein kinase [Streptomyces sp. NBC_01205]